jgi:3-oxoacyl-[acyl-carrier-protein] synthase III
LQLLSQPETQVEEAGGRLRGAAAVAIGVQLPEEIVTNAAIAQRLGVTDEWILARTGIRERRVAPKSETLPGLAAAAGARALEAAAIDPIDLDFVLVATMSHEQLTPHAAALVAEELGARRAGTMDLSAACSGFVSALALATAQVEAGRADAVLVIGADLMSRLTDPADRSTAALFGDGAGAMLIRSTSERGRIGPFIVGADGAQADLIRAEREEALMRMKGPDTFRNAVDRLSQVTVEASDAAGVDLDEIDLFAFHQANGRILSAVAERLGLDPRRVLNCIGLHGNTSAASIPLALADADADGRLREGSKVLLAAFGGGLSWAGVTLDWGPGHA